MDRNKYRSELIDLKNDLWMSSGKKIEVDHFENIIDALATDSLLMDRLQKLVAEREEQINS